MNLWTSESVTEGHPDKLCDQISDAVLDACLAQDPDSHVACETSAISSSIHVFGEISTRAEIDIDAIARQVLRDVGYHFPFGLDAAKWDVRVDINQQSSEIKVAVDHEDDKDEDPLDKQGAGDQGMMFGYACDETDSLMPLPIHLAHQLTKGLATLRQEQALPWLRPDGKSQVTVEYDANGKPSRIANIIISTQHHPSVEQPEIEAALCQELIPAALGTHANLLDQNTKYYINPSGSFVKGGPAADSGLTGRKIIVDTYGGMAHHGGGAFSGKDPSKVDRSAAYAARWVAKTIVAAGLADRVEVQVSYAIGIADPTSVRIDTFDSCHPALDEERLEALVLKHFDLRPLAIIEHLDLRNPIYRQTACYGHFGRADLDLPWERTDRAAALRRAAGL